MTIKERLRLLTILSKTASPEWFDNYFNVYNEENKDWWLFENHGITQVNLTNANVFWRVIYNKYKNKTLEECYHMLLLNNAKNIINQLKDIK